MSGLLLGLLSWLRYCSFALAAQFRLIAFQTLLRLLALLTLTQLLELRLTRLSNLAIDVLAALRLYLSRGTREEGGDKDE